MTPQPITTKYDGETLDLLNLSGGEGFRIVVDADNYAHLYEVTHGGERLIAQGGSLMEYIATGFSWT
jgi:hypothetical protein